MADHGKLVVITGPSGVGKSSIAREALQRTGAEFSTSATTRAPRPGEVDGRDYHFVSREAFEEMIRNGKMLEHAEVFGNLYGTPMEPVTAAIAEGRTIVLDIDVQGGVQVHEKMPGATFVLVVPPGMDELARRLRGRGTEDTETVNRRLAEAEAEIRKARQSGAYDREIVNDDLETAIQEMVQIIQE
ncbi:MAG: guanylate kinase [Phycisphaerae bacterium]